MPHLKSDPPESIIEVTEENELIVQLKIEIQELILVCTLYNELLRIARNLLETRENIKIESYSFYHIICD